MYYNVYEGMQTTWSDRLGSITRQFTSHNWLPAATAGMVALWVGLIFTAINQTGQANPGAPSDLGTAKSTPVMTVTTTADTNAEVTPSRVTSSSTNQSSAVQPAAVTPATVATNTTSTTSNAATNSADVIGGRGADSTTAPQTSSTPSTSDTQTNTGTDVGLSVQTPLTPDPITLGLGLNSGVQLDLGL